MNENIVSKYLGDPVNKPTMIKKVHEQSELFKKLNYVENLKKLL